MARPEGAMHGASAGAGGNGAAVSRRASGTGADRKIMLPKNRIIPAVIRRRRASTSLCMDQETCFAPASFPLHDDGAHPDRLLGLELPALARAVLPKGPAAKALVRLLRRAFRHRGDQQQLLPPSGRGDVREMARPGAAVLLLRGQGQ